MVRKDGPYAHGPGVQSGFPAETAERSMAMYNIDLFTDNDVAEYGEERKDGWERGRAVDDEEGHIVDLEAVRQVAYALAILVGVSYDHDLVPSVDESLG